MSTPQLLERYDCVIWMHGDLTCRVTRKQTLNENPYFSTTLWTSPTCSRYSDKFLQFILYNTVPDGKRLLTPLNCRSVPSPMFVISQRCGISPVSPASINRRLP